MFSIAGIPQSCIKIASFHPTTWNCKIQSYPNCQKKRVAKILLYKELDTSWLKEVSWHFQKTLVPFPSTVHLNWIKLNLFEDTTHSNRMYFPVCLEIRFFPFSTSINVTKLSQVRTIKQYQIYRWYNLFHKRTWQGFPNPFQRLTVGYTEAAPGLGKRIPLQRNSTTSYLPNCWHCWYPRNILEFSKSGISKQSAPADHQGSAVPTMPGGHFSTPLSIYN